MGITGASPYGHCQDVPVEKQPSRPAAERIRRKGKELEICRRGDEIILRQKNGAMLRAFELLASLPNDLTIADRKNDPPQKRNATTLKKPRRS